MRVCCCWGGTDRARGRCDAQSDWDFAFEADQTFDVDGLLAVLAERLNADRVDLVDLRRAGAAPGALTPSSDAADAVILHLWQATQIVIDLV